MESLSIFSCASKTNAENEDTVSSESSTDTERMQTTQDDLTEEQHSTQYQEVCVEDFDEKEEGLAVGIEEDEGLVREETVEVANEDKAEEKEDLEVTGEKLDEEDLEVTSEEKEKGEDLEVTSEEKGNGEDLEVTSEEKFDEDDLEVTNEEKGDEDLETSEKQMNEDDSEVTKEENVDKWVLQVSCKEGMYVVNVSNDAVGDLAHNQETQEEIGPQSSNETPESFGKYGYTAASGREDFCCGRALQTNYVQEGMACYEVANVNRNNNNLSVEIIEKQMTDTCKPIFTGDLVAHEEEKDLCEMSIEKDEAEDYQIPNNTTQKKEVEIDLSVSTSSAIVAVQKDLECGTNNCSDDSCHLDDYRELEGTEVAEESQCGDVTSEVQSKEEEEMVNDKISSTRKEDNEEVDVSNQKETEDERKEFDDTGSTITCDTTNEQEDISEALHAAENESEYLTVEDFEVADSEALD